MLPPPSPRFDERRFYRNTIIQSPRASGSWARRGLGGGAGDEIEGGGIGDWEKGGVLEGEAEKSEEKLEFSGLDGGVGPFHPPPSPRAASYEQYTTHRVTQQVGGWGGGKGEGTREGGRWLSHRANVLLLCC
jgi:hypothetical protein